MPTINAMMRGTSLMFKTDGKGISAGTLDYQSQLSSLLGVKTQTGVNYASFDYLDAMLAEKKTLSEMFSEYDKGKNTFKSEFKDEMKSVASASSALKKIDYKGTGTATAKAGEQAQNAAKTLSEYVNKSNMTEAQKSNLTDALNSFKNYAANPKGANNGAAQTGKTAANLLKAAVTKETGLDEKEAVAAKTAADKTAATADYYAEDGKKNADTMANGLRSITSYLNYFESTGRFEADAAKMNNVLNSLAGEINRAAEFQNNVNAAGNFVDEYKTDAETSENLANAVGSLQNFADGLEGLAVAAADENTAKDIAAVRQFLTEGQKATDETTANAKTALSRLTALADNYREALNADIDKDEFAKSAATVQRAADSVAQTYGQIGIVEDFDKSYESAQKTNSAVAQKTAKEINGLIDDYNDTIKYLRDNTGLSNRFDGFAKSFADAKYYANSLESVGITVQDNGTLKVDADTLASALQNNPNSVERILGGDGLAGRIDRNVSMSDYQAERMFPSIDTYMGGVDTSSSAFYSSNMMIFPMMYGNIGNFMDMYM